MRSQQQIPTRLAVIHIEELPTGWLGKPHAMATAAWSALVNTQAPPEFFLFTDADIFFAPSILRRSLAEAVVTRADHFITFPTSIAHTRGEAMLLSFLQVMSLFPVRPWRIASPKARDSVGVGAFNLIRTEAYLQVGGFDVMPMEIVEDLTLGRRIKAAGLRQRVAYAPGAVTFHWAPGLVGVLHGMTKNLFAVFRFRPLLLFGAALGLATLWIAPFVLLVFPATRLPASLAVASLIGLYVLVSRQSLISPGYAITAPVACAMVVYSMFRSMWVTLRDGGVTWRGTFYPLRELRRR